MVGLSGCSVGCGCRDRGNYRPLGARTMCGPSPQRRRRGLSGLGELTQSQTNYLKQIGATDAQISDVASGRVDIADMINMITDPNYVPGKQPDQGGVYYVPGTGSGTGDSASGSGDKKPGWSMPWWGWVAIGVGGLIAVRHV
jgi:hypothetical protein